MIAPGRRVRVFALGRPADLRLGFSGLFGLVQSEMRQDPMSGDLYLFTNRRRVTCKVLQWDGTGLCLYMKRLDRGRFACLWRSPEERPLSLTPSELALFIEGCSLVGSSSLSPAEIRYEAIASGI